jgi:hypothetical protein
MKTIFFSCLLILATNISAALPILTRPGLNVRPILVLKPEFARFHFQNIAPKFTTSKDVANYFNNNQIQGNFDPNELNPSQRQLWNQLISDMVQHEESFNEDLFKVFLQSLSGGTGDIDAIIQIVLFEVAKESNSDLKGMLNEMQNTQKKKREIRNFINSLNQRLSTCRPPICGSLTVELNNYKNQLDSLSQLGENVSLRLQMAMDRYSKMMSTLSNILKKISDTASSITQNMK